MSEQKRQFDNSGIILENRNRLNVSGVQDVIGFDDETVVMETVLGQLTVKGQGLKVQSFTVETGSLIVEGTVSAMVYTGANKKGAFKRLFS